MKQLNNDSEAATNSKLTHLGLLDNLRDELRAVLDNVQIAGKSGNFRLLEEIRDEAENLFGNLILNQPFLILLAWGNEPLRSKIQDVVQIHQRFLQKDIQPEARKYMGSLLSISLVIALMQDLLNSNSAEDLELRSEERFFIRFYELLNYLNSAQAEDTIDPAVFRV